MNRWNFLPVFYEKLSLIGSVALPTPSLGTTISYSRARIPMTSWCLWSPCFLNTSGRFLLWCVFLFEEVRQSLTSFLVLVLREEVHNIQSQSRLCVCLCVSALPKNRSKPSTGSKNRRGEKKKKKEEKMGRNEKNCQLNFGRFSSIYVNRDKHNLRWQTERKIDGQTDEQRV